MKDLLIIRILFVGLLAAAAFFLHPFEIEGWPAAAIGAAAGIIIVIFEIRVKKISLKRLINEALRRGLDDMGRRRRPREAIRTRAAALGRVRIASINNIGEALAIAEGEGFR